ncbi:DUF5701 family protein [Robiginitalea sp.]|uniref:DUF5701 family protein n=1 Tax=Robiginitalea sp. TaxID=1902411 RepID=UPI003C3E3F2F
MTLCKNQKEGLVAKLTAFFKGLSGDKIDEAVAQARKLANAETLEERKDKLVKLFESQLEKLKSTGTPQAILEVFQNNTDEVVSKAAEIAVAEGNIPFLPVIPRSYMGIYALMPMVKYNGKVGYIYLDPNELTDVVETPKTPYYAFDVENGKVMLGKSPKDAEKIIKNQKRSCLTADEVIAVGIHSQVLSDHYVDATGSRFKSDFVPGLCLGDDRPGLRYFNPDRSYDEWGSGSCGSRA